MAKQDITLLDRIALGRPQYWACFRFCWTRGGGNLAIGGDIPGFFLYGAILFKVSSENYDPLIVSLEE